MKKLDNLLEKDFHIVERRKTIFIIPLVIVVIAAIMMIIFNFTLGSPLYLGTDFAGGFSVDVALGTKLTDDNFDDYCEQIEEILSDVTSLDGSEHYSISIDKPMQMQGSGATSAIHVKCFALRGVDETDMSENVYPAISAALEERILAIIPSVAIDGNKITLTYGEPVYNDLQEKPQRFEELKNNFVLLVDVLNSGDVSNITIDGDVKSAVAINDQDWAQVIITCSDVNDTQEVRRAIATGMRSQDSMSGDIRRVSFVGATVSTELIFSAVLAVALALIFMLCYIGLRFQLSSGLACIIALFHDILIMFCSMAIFRIEINSTFIAALITILGYSINNSIIVFDRVRENMKSVYAKNMTAEAIANKSIKETIMRSINTTITTLIMILMVAIIGVRDIRIFAFPIIMGLLAGTFSSICIAPSLWALFQRVGKKGDKNITVTKAPKNKSKAETTAEVQA